MVANVTVEMVQQGVNQIGEAATWLDNEKVFLWVDISGCEMYEYNPDTKTTIKHKFDNMVSTIIPTQLPHVVVLAVKNKLLSYHLLTHATKTLVELPGEMTDLRTNDGKASPEGRIWLGVMHLSNHDHTGALYCIEKDLTISKVLDKQCIPNGIVWNKAGNKMYYADSGRACIEEYNYNALTGEIQFVKVAVTVNSNLGVPDGMTIDNDGNLWVAHWGGFGVYCWNPVSGEMIGKISVPVPNVASCTFDANNNLFITTARAGLTELELLKYPLSGSLFKASNFKTFRGINHYQYIIN